MTTRLRALAPPGASAHASFIARQPIFNERRKCDAYELLFRDGVENLCPPDMDPDDAATRTAHSAWLTFGLPMLVGDKTAFVNMTRDLLVADYGHAFPAESVVIELLETIDGDAEVVEACRKLKRHGYVLALDDFVYRPALDPLIPLADIIKIGLRDCDPAEQVEHVRRTATHDPTLLAEMVETREDYTSATDLGFTRFQGYFFCKPEVVEGRALTGVRMTYLKLVQAVTRAEMSTDEVEALIRADVSVTHRLLRFLDSAAFGFRTKIKSIRHALALLGRERTRRFVSLLALGELGSDKPHELLVSAAVRARFCELLGSDTLPRRESELFLLGALSLLDAMLDQPMSRVLDELPLSRDTRLALQGDPSPLRPVLEFVERYERGDWMSCSDLANRHGFVQEKVLERYREATVWAMQAFAA